MKSHFLVLPAAFLLSACAQPTMLSDLSKDCSERAAANLGPMPFISNLPGNVPVHSVGYTGRFSLETPSCAQKAQPQQPEPHTYDLHKVGEQPGGSLTASNISGSCPGSRV